MIVYLLNIGLLYLGYIFWSGVKGERGKAWFCGQATIQWVLLSGLRGLSVGADTGKYEYVFEQVKNMPWSQVLAIMRTGLFSGASFKDPGYYLFQKIFQMISGDYQIFLIFVAVLFFVPMARWIYKYSEDALLSYIVFSCLFYSFFAVTGTRQTIVTGIAVFLGTELLHKKRYILFYILLLALFPIHKSIITLAIYPFLFNRRINNAKVIVWTGVIGVCWIFRSRLMTILSILVNYENYDRIYEGAGATNFVILFMAVLFFGLLVRDHIIQEYDIANEAYSAMLIAACLLPLTAINQSAMRAVQYYSVYLIVFLPIVVKSFKYEQQRIVTVAGELLMIAFLISNNPSYSFFWQ